MVLTDHDRARRAKLTETSEYDVYEEVAVVGDRCKYRGLALYLPKGLSAAYIPMPKRIKTASGGTSHPHTCMRQAGLGSVSE